MKPARSSSRQQAGLSEDLDRRESTPQGFLDIEGSAGCHRCFASLKLGLAVLLVIIGWGLWSWAEGIEGFAAKESEGPRELCFSSWGVAFVLLASLAYPKERYIYLDITAREIVFQSSLAWWQLGSRRSALTEFDAILVRHLFHSGGEGSDTYTGSVGLRPARWGNVLWARSFPATEHRISREAFEFARKLQAMTGLPVVGTADFNHEAQT